MEKLEVKINTEFIKLDQLLKFSGLCDSGAMAKDMILSEMVFFNGQLCTMRGKKVRVGDIVRVDFEDGSAEITVED